MASINDIFSLFLGMSILWYITHRRKDSKTLQEQFVVSEIRRGKK